jgi:protein-L-isoaspartate(D-aspartate) O-methyltransferase
MINAKYFQKLWFVHPLLVFIVFLLLPVTTACNSPIEKQEASVSAGKNATTDNDISNEYFEPPKTINDFKKERSRMVRLLRAYGIEDIAVLSAMENVRRHIYIPLKFRHVCNPYGDHPCPIGHGQTISQPYIVAYMTERMNIKKGEKVLEIGTGSGYQAAILSTLGANVFSIEIVKELAQHSKNVLQKEGFSNVNVLHGNGYHGWEKHAPYDVILVTCAPEKIPPALVEQLKEGGRMIIPVGKFTQRLVILRKEKGKVIRKNDLNVRFVPMVDNDK